MESPADAASNVGSVRGLARVAMGTGLIAVFVGIGHLAAWLAGDLSRSGLTAITMKTNTALCLTLVGTALLLLAPAQAAPARRWSARVLAVVALAVGLLTFVENLAGWNLGIDELLAVEAPGAMAVASPNRMGMPASLGFTLASLALLIFSRRGRGGAKVGQGLALAICLISLLAIIGFLYGAQELYGIARYTGIAWPTAVSLLLLGMGLLCLRPTEGLMAQVTADDSGGISLRRLLPAAVVLPLLLGWLRLAGERAGAYDSPMGTGIVMLLLVLIFSALAYYVSRQASRSAKSLRENEERMRAIFDNAGVGLVEVANDDCIVVANDRLCGILGYERRELLGKRIHDLTAPE
ncbi:MAG: PAS domain-containing protein, partial [Phycisphaerales bacterium]